MQLILGQNKKMLAFPVKLACTVSPISLFMLSNLSERAMTYLGNLLSRLKTLLNFVLVADFCGCNISTSVFQPCSYGDNGQSCHVNLLASFFGRHAF